MMKRILLAVGVLALLSAAVATYERKEAGAGKAAAPASRAAESDILYYYCPMHPDIHKDRPGSCPICNMDLVPKHREGSAAPSAPGADQGIPEGMSPVTVTDYQSRLINVKTARVEQREITRTVRVLARRGDDGEGWVADIYALDIPYVKAGQKASARPLGGEGAAVEGKVTALLPYDGTQSRVRRARVSLTGAPSVPFVDLDIRSVRGPVLAVPKEAVMDTGSRRYVFVGKGEGHYVPREVQVGFRGDDLLEITDGLGEGETVVDGANFLVDADSRLSAILDDPGRQP